MKKIFLLITFIAVYIASSQQVLAFSSCVAKGEQNYVSLKLEYPLVYLNNIEAQNKINTDIAKYVYELKDNYDKGYFYDGYMNYSVKYEDEQYLSVTLTRYFNGGGAHGLYNVKGLVYDKKTGNRVPLSYFVTIKSPKQIEYSLRGYVAQLYNERMQQIYLGNNHVTKISEDYYLAGNGIIYLIYQPYQLSSFSEGATRVRLDNVALDYIKRTNNRY